MLDKFTIDALAVLADLESLCLDNDRERRIIAKHLAAEFALSAEGRRLLIRFDTVDPLPRNELEQLVRELRKSARV